MEIHTFNPKIDVLQKTISHYYFLKCDNDIKPYLIFPNLFTIFTIFKNTKITQQKENVFIEKDPTQKFTTLLIGPFDEMMRVHYLGNVEEITICFYNLGFNFFNVHQSSFLKNKIFSPWSFSTDSDEVFHRIFEENDLDKKVSQLENYLSKLVIPFQNSLLEKAIHIIHQEPEIKMAALVKRLKTSTKTLCHHFNKYIGRTPVEYKRILRFHNLCRKNEINLTQLSNSMRFFDQAHMIKDFKSLTGFTPKQFFRQKNPNLNSNIVWLNA